MAKPTLGADSAPDNSARAEWHAHLTQLRAVEALPDDQRSDETIDLAGDLVGKLLSLPAPDHAALVWKFDYILAVNETGDSTPSYTKSYVMQAIVDRHCYLGDSA